MKHLLLIIAALCSGCVSVPDRIDANWAHTSHPLLGAPFGPSYEEDTLDVAEVRARWEKGRYFSEMSLGAQMKDSGFAGDGFIFNSRIGVALWSKK